MSSCKTGWRLRTNQPDDSVCQRDTELQPKTSKPGLCAAAAAAAGWNSAFTGGKPAINKTVQLTEA